MLIADELGPLPETIRSRCQLVPFRRLSERAVRAEVERRAPGLGEEGVRAVARLAAGRLDRVGRLLDPAAAGRRDALLDTARAVYLDPAFDPAAAAAVVLAGAKERATQARAEAEEQLEGLEVPQRELEQRLRRAARGAEREQLLLALEELASWYRDLLVVGFGAAGVAVHADRLALLEEDATEERRAGAELAADLIRERWRVLEELNLQAPLALEALFVELRRALGATVPLAA